MSDKPSLYVVEKKEVIILVVLFVLVTVLSFTLGVRYGESVGKKAAAEQEAAVREHDEGIEAGGTLGKAREKGEDEKPAAKDEKAKAGEPAEAAKGEKEAAHEGAHEKEPAHENASPESAAKASKAAGGREVVDKNSDEYLLNALKDAGVEPPGGKAPQDAKLPEAVKEPKTRVAPSNARMPSGAYVIQVGSHPTRSEAESQVRALRAKKVSAEILAPFRDKQGEWHRVVIGSYKSKREAEHEAGVLKSRGSIVSYFVWRLP